MPKRFTDCDIWNEDWFVEIPKDYRTLWFFIKDNCDHAGVWKPNVVTFNKMFDCDVSLKDAFVFLNKEKERIALLKNGRWFLIGFIPFQYGQVLNMNNRLHKSILDLLKRNDVKLTSIRPQLEVMEGPKDKDKDKDIKILKKGVVGGNGAHPPKYCHDCGRYFSTEQAFEKHLTLCLAKKAALK